MFGIKTKKTHVWAADTSQVDPFRQFVRIGQLAKDVSWAYQITVHHDYMRETGVSHVFIAVKRCCLCKTFVAKLKGVPKVRIPRKICAVYELLGHPLFLDF